ncbi:MAG: hypothetical protein QXH55_00290 [Candidatus Korarchaeota archaeon]|nr:hypothetical protein [Thermoproteota archaeon]MCR8455318.1 hypothetical protein [Thermoproteota archaeon]MCR8462588.1 hypothetical protein [Thermoproteota archaeon]MCR8470684.1 hypothetical protein [Thermoproteota archaeon]MCR8471706.1 hypothetical protein [Thermoproteota archaeon]
MLRGLSRVILILLIISTIDAIMCIIVPLLEYSMHSYPSFKDTLYALFFAPEYLKTSVSINSSTIRNLALIIFSLILTAVTSERKSEAVLHYLGLIAFVLLLITVGDFTATFSLSSPGFLIVHNPQEFLGALFYRITIFLYHIPLAFCSLGIFLIVRKYRAITSELEALEQ